MKNGIGANFIAQCFVSEHLSAAKRDIAAGDKALRSAADHIAAAIEGGATQTDVAAQVGKSQPWVNRLLAWRTGGFKDGGPFAIDNAKAKAKAKIISDTNNQPKAGPTPTEKSEARARADQARAEAAEARANASKAKAEAAEARANARRAKAEFFANLFGGDAPASISNTDRVTMVKALGMLGSEHDGEVLNAARMAERLRRKLNVTWEQLIIEAVEIKQKAAA